MDLWMGVAIGAGSVVALVVAAMFVLGGSPGGFFAALALGRRCLANPATKAKVDALFAPPKPEPKPKPTGEPLWLLTVLQREGRLLDFLLEEIDAYSNDQIGAAVRDIHRGCKKAIREHLALEPILKEAEGARVEVPAGFDPSAIRLVGAVAGSPPFRGSLLHHGWRVSEVKLAKPPEGQDPFVVQPAEVEVS